jgi:hypothetical protein
LYASNAYTADCIKVEHYYFTYANKTVGWWLQRWKIRFILKPFNSYHGISLYMSLLDDREDLFQDQLFRWQSRTSKSPIFRLL